MATEFTMNELNNLSSTEMDRRQLLRLGSLAGAGLLSGALLAGCGGSGSGTSSASSSESDQSILGAAKIAEALAVTMYTGLINGPIFATLPSNDKTYFVAAQSEEMFHYNLLKSVTGGSDAQLNYYFPTGMFTNPQTTFNTLVTLEEAFIAAYLDGVKSLSTPALRVIAAQIMGVEAEHRVLARDAAGDLNLTTTTGLAGTAEPVNPPNNTVYESTYGVTTISVAVTALTPFLSPSASFTVKGTFNPAFVPNGAGLFNNPPS
jgi:Ferritin-like domain